MIGSGFQAQSQTEAIQCVRNLTDVRVRSRSKEKREAFAGANQGRAVDTAEEAVRGADIVVTCTPSKDPVIDDSWNTRGDRGVHVNARGANRDQRRELPSRLIHRVDPVAVDSIEVAKIEAGDLILAPVDRNDRRIVDLAKIEQRPPARPLQFSNPAVWEWETSPPRRTSTNACKK